MHRELALHGETFGGLSTEAVYIVLDNDTKILSLGQAAFVEGTGEFSMRRTNMEDAVGLLAVRRFGPALATLAIMFSAPAYAGIVYSQPGNGTACSPTCWTSSFDGTTTSYLTTDNFSLSKAASIETVQWQGFYYDYLNPSNNPVSPNTNFWEIVFYADVSGLPSPSSLLYEQAPSQVTSTLLGTSTFGGNTVTFTTSRLHCRSRSMRAPIPLIGLGRCPNKQILIRFSLGALRRHSLRTPTAHN